MLCNVPVILTCNPSLAHCVGEQEKEEAAEEAPPPGSAAAPKPNSQMRIVSYFGHWLCDCGRENALWDRCACSQVREEGCLHPQSALCCGGASPHHPALGRLSCLLPDVFLKYPRGSLAFYSPVHDAHTSRCNISGQHTTLSHTHRIGLKG